MSSWQTKKVTVSCGVLVLSLASLVSAIHVDLQEGTAIRSQGNFSVDNAINDVYATANANNTGWANSALGSNIAAFETAADIDLSSGTTLRFNIFAGGFTPAHTVGKYRIAYTTDDRSVFANGVDNGGDVAATWVELAPISAVSSGGATLTINPDNSVLASGVNPTLSTDTIVAKVGPSAAPITGFRIETLEDASLPNNGPGRSPNSNFVLREFDVAAFSGTQVNLANATAVRSQPGFSIDRVINGDFSYINDGNGWANNVQGFNAATFETVGDLGEITNLSVEISSGGFGVHTLGRFRISATTADRSLFADGNDNGGAGVGAEPIWFVLDADSVVSDNASTVFTELGDLSILASGGINEYENYTINFKDLPAGITGLRLETLEDASFVNNGPGRAGNGNFVVREFTVFATFVPEPTTGLLALLGVSALGMRRRRAA